MTKANARDSKVVQDIKPCEQPPGLKRPGKPAAPDRVRGFGVDVVTVQGDSARTWHLKARDDIHAGRLASTIGPNQPNDLAFLQRYVHIIKGFEPPECDAD